MSIMELKIETTPTRYISGWSSLNLDFDENNKNDWSYAHFWLNDRILKLYGKGTEVDTVELFGYNGVAERSVLFQAKGIEIERVYVANHNRAFLDLVCEYMGDRTGLDMLFTNVPTLFSDQWDAYGLYGLLVYLRDNFDRGKASLLDYYIGKYFPQYCDEPVERALNLFIV